MRKVIALVGIVLVVVVYSRYQRRPEPQMTTPSSEVPEVNSSKTVISPFVLTSPAFVSGGTIPTKYTCEGENINPPFKIGGIPSGARSLALIFDDPDVKPNPWVHWTLWNISPTTTTISEDSVPLGAVEGKTSFRSPGYGGSCPPTGTHHYSFRLYAVDTKLNLPSSATKAELLAAMEGHILAEAELVGLYKKSSSN